MRWWIKQRREDSAGGDFLFAYSDGVPLSLNHLCQTLQVLLLRLGIDKRISGKSFRRGGSRTIARIGASAQDLKTLGGWKSKAYEVYLRDSLGRPRSYQKFAEIIEDPEWEPAWGQVPSQKTLNSDRSNQPIFPY